MADAVSRLSSGRRIGVFAMQHGPGAENAFGGVAREIKTVKAEWLPKLSSDEVPLGNRWRGSFPGLGERRRRIPPTRPRPRVRAEPEIPFTLFWPLPVYPSDGSGEPTGA